MENPITNGFTENPVKIQKRSSGNSKLLIFSENAIGGSRIAPCPNFGEAWAKDCSNLSNLPHFLHYQKRLKQAQHIDNRALRTYSLGSLSKYCIALNQQGKAGFLSPIYFGSLKCIYGFQAAIKLWRCVVSVTTTLDYAPERAPPPNRVLNLKMYRSISNAKHSSHRAKRTQSPH